MARETNRADLVLSESHRQMLTELSESRTAPAREVACAKILLRYAEGISISDIQQQVGVSRPTIYKCIDKALAAGVPVDLKDTFHRPKEPEILADAKAWVVSLACTKLKDHGLAAELWTLSALACHVRQHAAAGFPRLVASEQNHGVAYFKGTRHQATPDSLLPGKARSRF
jgi:transposase